MNEDLIKLAFSKFEGQADYETFKKDFLNDIKLRELAYSKLKVSGGTFEDFEKDLGLSNAAVKTPPQNSSVSNKENNINSNPPSIEQPIMPNWHKGLFPVKGAVGVTITPEQQRQVDKENLAKGSRLTKGTKEKLIRVSESAPISSEEGVIQTMLEKGKDNLSYDQHDTRTWTNNNNPTVGVNITPDELKKGFSQKTKEDIQTIKKEAANNPFFEVDLKGRGTDIKTNICIEDAEGNCVETLTTPSIKRTSFEEKTLGLDRVNFQDALKLNNDLISKLTTKITLDRGEDFIQGYSNTISILNNLAKKLESLSRDIEKKDNSDEGAQFFQNMKSRGNAINAMSSEIEGVNKTLSGYNKEFEALEEEQLNLGVQYKTGALPYTDYLRLFNEAAAKKDNVISEFNEVAARGKELETQYLSSIDLYNKEKAKAPSNPLITEYNKTRERLTEVMRAYRVYEDDEDFQELLKAYGKSEDFKDVFKVFAPEEHRQKILLEAQEAYANAVTLERNSKTRGGKAWMDFKNTLQILGGTVEITKDINPFGQINTPTGGGFVPNIASLFGGWVLNTANDFFSLAELGLNKVGVDEKTLKKVENFRRDELSFPQSMVNAAMGGAKRHFYEEQLELKSSNIGDESLYEVFKPRDKLVIDNGEVVGIRSKDSDILEGFLSEDTKNAAQNIYNANKDKTTSSFSLVGGIEDAVPSILDLVAMMYGGSAITKMARGFRLPVVPVLEKYGIKTGTVLGDGVITPTTSVGFSFLQQYGDIYDSHIQRGVGVSEALNYAFKETAVSSFMEIMFSPFEMKLQKSVNSRMFGQLIDAKNATIRDVISGRTPLIGWGDTFLKYTKQKGGALVENYVKDVIPEVVTEILQNYNSAHWEAESKDEMTKLPSFSENVNAAFGAAFITAAVGLPSANSKYNIDLRATVTYNAVNNPNGIISDTDFKTVQEAKEWLNKYGLVTTDEKLKKKAQQIVLAYDEILPQVKKELEAFEGENLTEEQKVAIAGAALDKAIAKAKLLKETDKSSRLSNKLGSIIANADARIDYIVKNPDSLSADPILKSRNWSLVHEDRDKHKGVIIWDKGVSPDREYKVGDKVDFGSLGSITITEIGKDASGNPMFRYETNDKKKAKRQETQNQDNTEEEEVTTESTTSAQREAAATTEGEQVTEEVVPQGGEVNETVEGVDFSVGNYDIKGDKVAKRQVSADGATTTTVDVEVREGQTAQEAIEEHIEANRRQELDSVSTIINQEDKAYLEERINQRADKDLQDVKDAFKDRGTARQANEVVETKVSASNNVDAKADTERRRQALKDLMEATGDDIFILGTQDGTFAGDGLLNMNDNGDVVLTRYADSEEGLTKGKGKTENLASIAGQFGGEQIATSGIEGGLQSFTNGVVGEYHIPLNELIQLIKDGYVVFAGLGNKEFVLSPHIADKYLTKVNGQEINTKYNAELAELEKQQSPTPNSKGEGTGTPNVEDWSREQQTIENDKTLSTEQKEKAKIESTAKALEGVDETQLISGEDVWNNATKAGSENNDFIENMEEYEGQIKGRQYLKVPISIDLLRANDKDLNEYLNDIDTSVKKRKIETPIIVGDAERGAFETTKDGVIDGFHRAEQAIINGEKNIIAFVPINSKIISETYHKAKADGSNPELVAAVEGLLGKPTEQPKPTNKVKGVSPNSNEDNSALRDVESTAKALDGNKNILPNIINKIKNIFFTGRGKKYDDLQKTKGDFIFFSNNKKNAEWYGGDESNVSAAFIDDSEYLDLTSQSKKSKFVEENFTDDDILKLYKTEIDSEIERDRFGRKTKDQLIEKYRDRARNERFSGSDKEQKFLLEKAKSLGVKGIKLLDTFFGKKDVSTIAIDKSTIKTINSKNVSEAYHKAKADGSNPELVKAVEELLKPKEPTKVQEVKQEVEVQEQQETAKVEETPKKTAPKAETNKITFKLTNTGEKEFTKVGDLWQYEVGGKTKTVRSESNIAALDKELARVNSLEANTPTTPQQGEVVNEVSKTKNTTKAPLSVEDVISKINKLLVDPNKKNNRANVSLFGLDIVFNGIKDNIGIPLWNRAIRLLSKEVEKGSGTGRAILKAANYIEENIKGKDWGRKAFINNFKFYFSRLEGINSKGVTVSITPYAGARIQKYKNLQDSLNAFITAGNFKAAQEVAKEMQDDLIFRLNQLLPDVKIKGKSVDGLWQGSAEQSFSLHIDKVSDDVFAAIVKIAQDFDQDAVHILYLSDKINNDEIVGVEDANGRAIIPVVHFKFDKPITAAEFGKIVKDNGLEGASLDSDGRGATIYDSTMYATKEEAEKGHKVFFNKVNNIENDSKRITGTVRRDVSYQRFAAFKRGGEERNGRTYAWGHGNIQKSDEYRARENDERTASGWAVRHLPKKVRDAVQKVASLTPKIGTYLNLNKSSDDYKRLQSIGRMFDRMPLVDLSPKVKAAYNALNEIIKAQYDRLPIKVYPNNRPIISHENIEQIQGIVNELNTAIEAKDIKKITELQKQLDNVVGWSENRYDDAYSNSKQMMADVNRNNQMEFFTTGSGFGDGSVDYTGHPLLEPTYYYTTPVPAQDKNGKIIYDKDGNEVLIPKQLSNNDVLRVVHDYVAHAASGASFGAKGEERAWAAHVASIINEQGFSDRQKLIAIQALTSETRGQNTWVNFVNEFNRDIRNPLLEIKRNAEKNNDLDTAAKADEMLSELPYTEFADQKVGLLPTETMIGGYEETADADKWIKEKIEANKLYESEQSDGNMKEQSLPEDISDVGEFIDDAREKVLKDKMGASTNKGRGIRFLILGEKGAEVLDKYEEATYRMDNLQVAREMEKEFGLTPEDWKKKGAKTEEKKKVLLATGWQRGVDGMWRYEFLDGELKVKSIDELKSKAGEKTYGGFLPINLSDIIELGDLSELYGVKVEYYDTILNSIGGIIVYLDNTVPIGQAYYSNGGIHVNPHSIKYNADFTEDGVLNKFKSIILHEIQHHIQVQEGFSEPFNEEGFKFKVKYEIDKIEEDIKKTKAISEFEPEYKERLPILYDRLGALESLEQVPQEWLDKMYWLSVGEVEARNVQERMNMTPEQRRQTLLEETEDVAREDQIVMMDGVEQAMSLSDSESQPITEAESKTLTDWLNKAFGGAVRVFSDWNKFKKIAKELGLSDKDVEGVRLMAGFQKANYNENDKVKAIEEAKSRWRKELPNSYEIVSVDGSITNGLSIYTTIRKKGDNQTLTIRESDHQNGLGYKGFTETNNGWSVADWNTDDILRFYGDKPILDKNIQRISDIIGFLTKFKKQGKNENNSNSYRTLKKELEQLYEKTQVSTDERVQFLQYPGGTVYGAVLPDGSMYLNPKKLNANTPIHEHTHLFNQVIHQINPKLWNKMVGAAKRLDLWKEVKNDPNYANLKTDSQIADEVYSRLAGNKGEIDWQERIAKADSKSALAKVGEFIKEYWNNIKEFFGADIYKDMSADDFANMTLDKLFGGKKIKGVNEVFKGNKNNDIRFSISNSNTNFNENEKTKRYKDSQGNDIPYNVYTPNGNSTSTNLLQRQGNTNSESDFALVERRFIRYKQLNFTAGTKIKSLDDVAWLFRNLEDEAVEHSFVTYIMPDDSYVVQHLGTGGITGAIIDNRLVVGNAIKMGAKSITFVHNHPSGKLEASKQDMNVYSALKKGLEGTGIDVQDGVIINLKSGKFVTFDSNSDIVRNITEQNQEQHKVKVLSFSKQVFAENYNPEQIKNSSDVAKLLSTKKFGVSDKTEMLILNNSHEVVGKFVLPESNQYSKIVELLTQYGGVSTILYGNNINPTTINEYNKKLRGIGFEILDGVEVKSNNFKSLADIGLINEGESDYNKNNTENENNLSEILDNRGIDNVSLRKLNEYGKQIEQRMAIYQRFSQEEQRGFTSGGSRHVEASLIAGRSVSTGETQDDRADRQEEEVETYAKQVGIWHDNTEEYLSEKYGEPINSGNESLVYYNTENATVVKTSNISQYRDLEDALDSITLHNTYFPESNIQVLGFGLDGDENFQIITEQPYITEGNRKATQEEIDDFVQKLGFEPSTKLGIAGRYVSDQALLNDLTPKNVILTPKGQIVPIDTIMHLNTEVWGESGKRIPNNNIYRTPNDAGGSSTINNIDTIDSATRPPTLKEAATNLKDAVLDLFIGGNNKLGIHYDPKMEALNFYNKGGKVFKTFVDLMKSVATQAGVATMDSKGKLVWKEWANVTQQEKDGLFTEFRNALTRLNTNINIDEDGLEYLALWASDSELMKAKVKAISALQDEIDSLYESFARGETNRQDFAIKVQEVLKDFNRDQKNTSYFSASDIAKLLKAAKDVKDTASLNNFENKFYDIVSGKDFNKLKAATVKLKKAAIRAIQTIKNPNTTSNNPNGVTQGKERLALSYNPLDRRAYNKLPQVLNLQRLPNESNTAYKRAQRLEAERLYREDIRRFNDMLTVMANKEIGKDSAKYKNDINYFADMAAHQFNIKEQEKALRESTYDTDGNLLDIYGNIETLYQDLPAEYQEVADVRKLQFDNNGNIIDTDGNIIKDFNSLDEKELRELERRKKLEGKELNKIQTAAEKEQARLDNKDKIRNLINIGRQVLPFKEFQAILDDFLSITDEQLDKLSNQELEELIKGYDNLINLNRVNTGFEYLIKKALDGSVATEVINTLDSRGNSFRSLLRDRITNIFKGKNIVEGIERFMRNTPLRRIDAIFSGKEGTEMYDTFIYKIAQGMGVFTAFSNKLKDEYRGLTKSIKQDDEFLLRLYTMDRQYRNNPDSDEIMSVAEEVELIREAISLDKNLKESLYADFVELYDKLQMEHGGEFDYTKIQLDKRQQALLDFVDTHLDNTVGKVVVTAARTGEATKIYNNYTPLGRVSSKSITDEMKDFADGIMDFDGGVANREYFSPITPGFIKARQSGKISPIRDVLFSRVTYEAIRGIHLDYNMRDAFKTFENRIKDTERELDNKIKDIRKDAKDKVEKLTEQLENQKQVLTFQLQGADARTARVLNGQIADIDKQIKALDESDIIKASEEKIDAYKNDKMFIQVMGKVVKDVAKDTLHNQYAPLSGIDIYTELVASVGYASVLTSIPRGMAEFASNIFYASLYPVEMMLGVKQLAKMLKDDKSVNRLKELLTQIPSTQPNRLIVHSGSLRRDTAETKKFGIAATVGRGKRIVENLTSVIDSVNDAILGTSDRVISMPMWLGAFEKEFNNQKRIEIKNRLGRSNYNSESEFNAAVNKEFKKERLNLEEFVNNSDYRFKNKVISDKAVKFADRVLTEGFASFNAFEGIPNLKMTKGDGFLKVYDKFLQRFNKFEYQSFEDSISSLLGRGYLSKSEAARVLTATLSRLAIYNYLAGKLRDWWNDEVFAPAINNVSNTIGEALGVEGDKDLVAIPDRVDNTEEEDLYKKKRAFIGGLISVSLQRRLGGLGRLPINFAVEMANGLYGEDLGLRKGAEYNAYENSLLFSTVKIPNFTSLQREDGELSDNGLNIPFTDKAMGLKAISPDKYLIDLFTGIAGPYSVFSKNMADISRLAFRNLGVNKDLAFLKTINPYKEQAVIDYANNIIGYKFLASQIPIPMAKDVHVVMNNSLSAINFGVAIKDNDYKNATKSNATQMDIELGVKAVERLIKEETSLMKERLIDIIESEEIFNKIEDAYINGIGAKTPESFTVALKNEKGKYNKKNTYSTFTLSDDSVIWGTTTEIDKSDFEDLSEKGRLVYDVYNGEDNTTKYFEVKPVSNKYQLAQLNKLYTYSKYQKVWEDIMVKLHSESLFKHVEPYEREFGVIGWKAKPTKLTEIGEEDPDTEIDITKYFRN